MTLLALVWVLSATLPVLGQQLVHPCKEAVCGKKAFYYGLPISASQDIGGSASDANCKDLPTAAYGDSAVIVVWSGQVSGVGNRAKDTRCGTIFGNPLYYYNQKLCLDPTYDTSLQTADVCTSDTDCSGNLKCDYPVADIMFSKSTDNGVNWSTPSSILPANHPLKALWNNAPRISTSGGKFVIVWSSGWKIYSSVSSDAGATWVAPVLVNSDIDSTIYSNTDFTSQYTYKDGDAYDPLHPAGMAPEIQRGANSEWLCTFHQQTNGGNYRSLVYKSSDDGTSWTQTATLVDDVGDGRSDIFPRLAWAGGQDWMAVWQSKSSAGFNNIQCAVSSDGGDSWGNYTFITSTTDQEKMPSIAHGKGMYVVAWESAGAAISTSYSQTDPTSWSAPATIKLGGSTSVEHYKPVIIFDEKTNFLVSFLAAHATTQDCDNSFFGEDQDVFLVYSNNLSSTPVWSDPFNLDLGASNLFIKDDTKLTDCDYTCTTPVCPVTPGRGGCPTPVPEPYCGETEYDKKVHNSQPAMTTDGNGKFVFTWSIGVNGVQLPYVPTSMKIRAISLTSSELQLPTASPTASPTRNPTVDPTPVGQNPSTVDFDIAVLNDASVTSKPQRTVETEILDDIKLALSLSGYTLTGVYTLNSVKSIHTFKLTILRDSGPFSDDEVGSITSKLNTQIAAGGIRHVDSSAVSSPVGWDTCSSGRKIFGEATESRCSPEAQAEDSFGIILGSVGGIFVLGVILFLLKKKGIICKKSAGKQTGKAGAHTMEDEERAFKKRGRNSFATPDKYAVRPTRQQTQANIEAENEALVEEMLLEEDF